MTTHQSHELIEIGAVFDRFGQAISGLRTEVHRMMREFKARFLVDPAFTTDRGIDACRYHLGVRRVTARQYRTWKRQIGRRK